MAEDEHDFKVGPGRPPLRTRLRKGQSGNPGVALTRDVGLSEAALMTDDELAEQQGRLIAHRGGNPQLGMI